MFVNYEWYASHGFHLLDDDDYEYITKAERQINTLCFNNIYNGNINRYMNTTQHIVKSIICEHADYLKENEENLDNGALKSYSNGQASYSFYNSNYSITNVGGFPIKASLYEELIQMGLCSRCL